MIIKKIEKVALVSFIMISLLAACSSAIKSKQEIIVDLGTAQKNCKVSDNSPTAYADFSDCLTTYQRSFIEENIPEALSAYDKYAEKRKVFETLIDTNQATSISNLTQFMEVRKKLMIELDSHEPKIYDEQSALSKDMKAVNYGMACHELTWVKNAECEDNLVRPIWSKNAPESLSYYNIYSEKIHKLSALYDKQYDFYTSEVDSGPQIQALNLALEEFKTEAGKAVQQELDKKQASKEEREKILHALGQVVEAVVVVAVIAGVVAIAILLAKQPHRGSGGGGGGGCCKICSVGKACGNTCIAAYDVCHVPQGCACNQ